MDRQDLINFRVHCKNDENLEEHIFEVKAKDKREAFQKVQKQFAVDSNLKIIMVEHDE